MGECCLESLDGASWICPGENDVLFWVSGLIDKAVGRFHVMFVGCRVLTLGTVSSWLPLAVVLGSFHLASALASARLPLSVFATSRLPCPSGCCLCPLGMRSYEFHLPPLHLPCAASTIPNLSIMCALRGPAAAPSTRHRLRYARRSACDGLAHFCFSVARSGF